MGPCLETEQHLMPRFYEVKYVTCVFLVVVMSIVTRLGEYRTSTALIVLQKSAAVYRLDGRGRASN